VIAGLWRGHAPARLSPAPISDLVLRVQFAGEVQGAPISMLAASRRDKADVAKHGGDPDVHRAGHRVRGGGSAGQLRSRINPADTTR